MSGAPGAVLGTDPEAVPSELPDLPESADATPTFRWSTSVLLGAAGFLINLLHLQLSPGIDMVFGGIPALLAAVTFGPWHGLLAGTIAGASTIGVWGHPWGWLLFSVETAVVGWMVRRFRSRPVIAVLSYWAVIGVPALYLISILSLRVDLPTFGVLSLKVTLNGIFDAVMIEMLLLFPFVRWLLRIPGSPRLQSAIAVVVTTAAIVPALVFGIWVGRREWPRNLQQAQERALSQSQTYATKLEQFVMLHESTIRSAAQAAERWDLNVEELQRLVTILSQQFPGFLQVYATNPAGEIIAAQSNTREAAPSPAFLRQEAEVLSGEGLVGVRRTFLAESRSDQGGVPSPVVFVAHPVAPEGEFSGYVAATVDLRRLPEPSPLPRRNERLLVSDGDGVLLYDSRTGGVPMGSGTEVIDSSTFSLLRAGGVPAIAVYTAIASGTEPRGRGAEPDPHILAGVAAIPGLGWWVWKEVPYAGIRASVAEAYLRLFGLLIAVSLLALLVSSTLARFLSQPLLRLRSAAASLAQGNLLARVGRLPPEMPQEIRELGSGFDEMATALAGRQEELEELGDLARSLASTLDTELLLPRITEAAERLVDPDGVGIVLISDAGTSLRAADYALGMLADSAGREIPLECTIAGWVTQNRQSVLIGDTRNDWRIRGAYIDRDAVGSVICAPLVGRSGALGALTAVYARASNRTFDHSDRQLLERLAGTAAAAVENARLLEAAESASRAKSAFIATLSHELRTPLNGLVGNLELLEMGIYGGLSKRQVDTLARMQIATDQLRELIEELLSFSRLESGRMEVHPTEVRLNTLLDEVASLMAPLAREKGLSYETEVQKEVLPIVTDPDKVRQILVHLIGNAIKFTVNGGVVVSLEDSEEGSGASISVRDSGVGIPLEDQRRLFEPFEQLDAGLSRNYGGAGLGLYLSGRYAELIGARITVRSKAGEGSEFTLTLPRHQ